MIDKELIVQRLSYIKMLFKVGIEQSKQSEATSAFSLFSFHDSIEMFLILAAEHLNIKRDRKDNFTSYWEVIPNLTLKESMNNLNKRRNNLKHHGLIPGKIEIEASRVNSIDFFEQNTKPIFDLEFSEISLFELIKFSKTKDRLVTSQLSLDKNDIDNCVKEAAISFQQLLIEYKSTKRRWGRSDFHFIDKVKVSSPRARALGDDSKNQFNSEVEKAFQKTNKNFEEIQAVLEVISLGLDYRKYTKFKNLTPYVFVSWDEDFVVELRNRKNWTKENCQFLIDFVLESSLKLQEFDYDNDTLEESEFTVIQHDPPTS